VSVALPDLAHSHVADELTHRRAFSRLKTIYSHVTEPESAHASVAGSVKASDISLDSRAVDWSQIGYAPFKTPQVHMENS
jgi:hypothetical protein